jgi:hypothetical protein
MTRLAIISTYQLQRSAAITHLRVPVILDSKLVAPKLRTVLGDSDCTSEETFAGADNDGLRPLAPLAKDPAGATSAHRGEPGTWTGFRPPAALDRVRQRSTVIGS